MYLRSDDIQRFPAGAILGEKPLGTYYGGHLVAGIGWGHSFQLSNDISFKDDDLSTWTVEEFYYVLWIEWESGIAYRKGLGRVLNDAWERELKDEVD
jgi:hypothetical protein